MRRGEDLDDGEVVGDEQAGEADLPLQLLEQVEHAGLDRHVERRRRLVGDEQPRTERQRPGDADPLALAAGELVGVAVAQVAARWTRSSSSSTRLLSSAPLATFGSSSGSPIDSPTGSRGLSDDPGSWNTKLTSRRTLRRSSLEIPTMFVPSTDAVPSTNGSSPTMARPIVVLPEPDSPTSPTTSPVLDGQRHAVDGAERRRPTPLGVLDGDVAEVDDELVGARRRRRLRFVIGLELVGHDCPEVRDGSAAALGVRVSGRVEDLVGVARLDDLAALHHEDPVGRGRRRRPCRG